MTDLTPLLNAELKRREAPPTVAPSLTLQSIDEFLKEAYRINSHIASLNTYLRGVRQSYLSTSSSRRFQPSRTDQSKNLRTDKQSKVLTDRQRDEIDAETKQVLRELNASIRNLADAEQLRQNTETTLMRKKFKSSLGVLGSWAAGGVNQSKSSEHELEEAKAAQVSTHREEVLFYLRRKLHECGGLQASMMETRITREIEKNKSMLEKSRSTQVSDFAQHHEIHKPTVPRPTSLYGAHLDESVEEEAAQMELSPEQLQMFEQENADMLKHYEATLNQVRTAEKSLVEISELQSQLVHNLATQSEHIQQLVVDSELTADNVGGGNKQLKRATERKSTAKYVFYASCGLSLTLVVWDLLI